MQKPQSTKEFLNEHTRHGLTNACLHNVLIQLHNKPFDGPFCGEWHMTQPIKTLSFLCLIGLGMRGQSLKNLYPGCHPCPQCRDSLLPLPLLSLSLIRKQQCKMFNFVSILVLILVSFHSLKLKCGLIIFFCILLFMFTEFFSV